MPERAALLQSLGEISGLVIEIGIAIAVELLGEGFDNAPDSGFERRFRCTADKA